MSHRATDALPFTIEVRALVYARQSRKVARFDPPRLVAECPMPACGWTVTAPDSPAGAALAVIGRARHATGDHPAAIEAGMLILADAPYGADDAVDQVIIVRHDVTAAECGPTCTPERRGANDSVDVHLPTGAVIANAAVLPPTDGDYFGAGLGRGMRPAGPAPLGSGTSSGVDMSSAGDHGIVRRLP